jgi:type I restriction enzyme S subunit
MRKVSRISLSEVICSAGSKAGDQSNLPVHAVTKYQGFVPSLDYFKKQVFSRDLSSYKLVNPGEFAYATIHLDEGSIGIADTRCLISPMYTVFKISNEKVNSSFLLRYLKSPQAMAIYPQLGKGSVHRRRAISLRDLSTLTIPLLPIEEQHKIANILNIVDALRTKRRETIAFLDELTQSIFLDMFGDPAVNNQWPRVTLNSISSSLRNGVSPSSKGKIRSKVLTLSAITGSSFKKEAWKFGYFTEKPPSRQTVTTSDFLICRGNGNVNLVGKGFFPTQEMTDTAFPDTIIAAKISPDLIEPRFLQHIWGTQGVRRKIESVARTTNGTYKVNQTGLGDVQFISPDFALQKRFANRTKQVDAIKQTHQAHLAQLDELFASLQYRAFRGELFPETATQEAAAS